MMNNQIKPYTLTDQYFQWITGRTIPRHNENITNTSLRTNAKKCSVLGGENRGGKMLEDPRLRPDRVRVSRRDNYEKRPVLSATIHPDIKRTLVAM